MEYKYWDIINIPGRKSEGAKTSAPSADDHAVEVGTVLDVGGTSLSVTETLKGMTAVSSDTVSPEYVAMLNNAISKGDVFVEPVGGTDGYSVSLKVPDNPSGLIVNDNPVPLYEDVAYVRSPEEADAAKYMTADDVDYTKYDTPSENIETSEENLGEDFDFDKEAESSDEKQDEIIDAIKRVEEKVDGVKNDKYVTMDQLTALFDSVAGEKKKPVTTELDEHEVAEVLRSFEKFQAKYFPELPIRNEICKRFLFNIPRRVYDTHIAVSECYSDPDIFDPLFWLLLCFTECKREDVALFISAIDKTLTDCEEEISNTLVNLLGDGEDEGEEEDEETVDVDVTVEDVEE